MSYLYNVPSYHSSVTFWCHKWDPFVLNGSSDADPGAFIVRLSMRLMLTMLVITNVLTTFLFMNSTGYQKGLEDDDLGKSKATPVA